MRITKLLLSPFILTGFIFTACTHTPPSDFIDSDLTGRINGQDWEYKHAYIDPTLPTPEEDDVVFVFLPYVPKDPCPRDRDGKDTRSVMVAAPKLAKVIKLKAGTHRNLVFQYDDKKGQQVANSAKQGKIKLTNVTDKTVKGRLFATFNEANWISGNFSAVVCDSMALR